MAGCGRLGKKTPHEGRWGSAPLTLTGDARPTQLFWEVPSHSFGSWGLGFHNH